MWKHKYIFRSIRVGLGLLVLVGYTPIVEKAYVNIFNPRGRGGADTP